MPDTPPDADQLPKEIADDETIVRGILTPWHYKRGKLKKQAFKPPAGSSELSVIRLLMGPDFCKNKATEIAAANTNNKYSGLLAIRADAIRNTGSTVKDSRDPPNFLGHADIDHGFKVPGKDEPPATPEDLQRLDDRLDELLKHANYHDDPEPLVPGWKGSAIKVDSK